MPDTIYSYGRVTNNISKALELIVRLIRIAGIWRQINLRTDEEMSCSRDWSPWHMIRINLM